MDDIKLPKVLEFFKTTSLTKGRIETGLHLFMIDAEVFERICLAFIRGETKSVECRVGHTRKHPKDKYDKVIAKQEVYKKIKKQHLNIRSISSADECTTIFLQDNMYIKRGSSGRVSIHEQC